METRESSDLERARAIIDRRGQAGFAEAKDLVGLETALELLGEKFRRNAMESGNAPDEEGITTRLANLRRIWEN